MKDVLIFAGSAIGSVLALAEEIKQSYDVKTTVIGLKSNHKITSILKVSKFIDEVETFNYSSHDDFFNQIKNWTKNKEFTKKPLVYFTTDSSCYLVNLYRDWFEENYDLVLPSSEIINIYTQKGKAEIDAERNGLLCPKSIVIKSDEDVFLVENEFNFPVIIKPTTSYNNNKAPFKTKKLNKKEFLKTQLDLLQKGYQVICQEFIPGGDNKAFFYIFNRNEKGKKHYVLGRKVLQSPPQAGIMAKGVVEENEELSIICARFLDKINYTGIGGVEFKEHNGRYYFIEMSTRLEGFFKIGNLAGVPLGKIAYETFYGFKQNKIYTAKIGSEYNDLLSLMTAYKNENKYFLLIKELCSVLLFKKSTLNVYSKHDRKPFFKMLKSYIR